jgi:hypothetical protein
MHSGAPVIVILYVRGKVHATVHTTTIFCVPNLNFPSDWTVFHPRSILLHDCLTKPLTRVNEVSVIVSMPAVKCYYAPITYRPAFGRISHVLQLREQICCGVSCEEFLV